MNLSTSHINDPKFKRVAQKIVAEMKRLEVPGVANGDFLRDGTGRLRFFRIGGRAHKKIN